LQDKAPKPLGTSDLSDSGYNSIESGNLGTLLSSNKSKNTETTLPKSQSSSRSQPESDSAPANAQSTWDADNGLIDMNSGDGVMDSHDAGQFDTSWLENDPQLADMNAWNPCLGDMGMEYPNGPGNEF
jgi:hypothetical protein